MSNKEKATHQDMTDFEGPVSTGDAQAKRKLDKKQGSPENETTLGNGEGTEVMPSGKVAEELTALFAGVEGLSEEFTTKATVIFEGAVSEYVSNLKEEYEVKLNEAIEENQDILETQLDRYLSLVVENYFKENEVAIDRGIRNDIAESVISSMVSIVENAGIELPEDKVDVAEELAKEVQSLETKLNESQEEIIDLRDSVKKYQLEEAFRDNTAGLSEGSVDKLRKLTENMSFTDVDQFISKLDILKESLTEKLTNTNTVVEALTEAREENITEGEKKLEPWQQAILDATRNG